MGDIPGVEYTPPVPIAREAIPRHDAVPEIRSLGEIDRGFLSWGMRELPPEERTDPTEVEWQSLGAPTTEHLRETLERTDVSPSELLSRLWEALELPGAAEDYHHALERVVTLLARIRTGDAEALVAAEELAWLDIRLMLARPDTVLTPYMDGRPRYWGANTFTTLRSLYVSEGFLREAVRVADLEAENFGHAVRVDPSGRGFDPARTRDELRSRLEVIHDESAA
jgi:hypothetical protein